MASSSNGTDSDLKSADLIPEWDDYWMSVAESIKERSPDVTSVGAVIVKNKVLVSTGYNGFARGVYHLHDRLIKVKDDPEKLRWMCHAEQNAIFNAARAGVSVEGGTIYTTKFPCLFCTFAIVQSGIKTIYTTDTKMYNDDLLKDSGERVLKVITETGVLIDGPDVPAIIDSLLKCSCAADNGSPSASRNGKRRARTGKTNKS